MGAHAPADGLQVSGKGLITGQPVTVRITPGPHDSGVVFEMPGGSEIPARLGAVAQTDRGVTLGNAQGKTLSIVEHFLCAAALSGHTDLRVFVEGAPELPILDGGAQQWLGLLEEQFGPVTIPADIDLPKAVFYRHDEHTCIYALPADHFRISYAVNFEHPDLNGRWTAWDSRDAAQRDRVANACTFGYLHELPAMQARGLAMGVDEHNTLGLTDTGYSRPLRHEDEPVYHKMLDLIGDLSLSGLNPLRLNAHVFALNAGHGSHTAFARKLLAALGRDV